MAKRTKLEFRGSSKTIPKIVAALLFLLLILEKPAPSSARFMRKLTSVTPRRNVLDSSTPGEPKPSTLKVELMSAQHVDSPYAQPNLTLSQRMEIAAKSSRARAQYIASKIDGKQAKSGSKVERKLIYSSPLYSAEISYVMTLTLGTPASTFVVNADTGSDLVWVQCPCSTCISEPDSPFDPTTSSTYSAVPCTNGFCVDLSSQASCSTSQTCQYEYSYGDQSSTQGDLATETITLGSTDGSDQAFPEFVFGCGSDNQGTFQNVDGLAGLGRGELSLVSQLGSQINNIFSYCLVDFYSATTVTSPLLFGSAGDLSLSYTALIPNSFNPTYYYVNVVGITVNDQPLDYPDGTFTIDPSTGQGGLILDSGTTFTQLVPDAYNPLLSALSALIDYPTVDESSQDLDLCYDVSNVDSPVYPTVVFQFDGVDVSLTGENLFLPWAQDGTVCLAMQATEGSFAIFGNVQQQNFQIAYDNGNAQVGIAPTTCSS